MKHTLAGLLAVAALTGCGSPALSPVRQPAALPQVSSVVTDALLVAKGRKFTYLMHFKTAKETKVAGLTQEITAWTPAAVTVKNSLRPFEGKQTTSTEKWKPGKAFLTSLGTSSAPPSGDIDPATGTLGVTVVPAGVFRTRKVEASENGATMTYWFDGIVPVKVVWAGLDGGNLTITAQLDRK